MELAKLRNQFNASFAFLAVLGGAVLACGFPTVSIENPVQEPSEADIIGTWTRDRCRSMDSRFDENPSIWTCMWIFKSDGAFQMVDVPEWLMVGRWDSTGNSATGSWNNAQSGGHWVIRLDFSAVNDREEIIRRELVIYGR